METVLGTEDVVTLYRRGKVRSLDGATRIGMLRDYEIRQLDEFGVLVATGGFVTYKGSCDNCKWEDHVHVADTEAGCRAAKDALEKSHTNTLKLLGGCQSTPRVEPRK